MGPRVDSCYDEWKTGKKVTMAYLAESFKKKWQHSFVFTVVKPVFLC
jgi:hypothetical protein